MRGCAECTAPLAKGTKGDICRPCWNAHRKRPDRFCATCSIKLGRGNSSGFCRVCLLDHHRDNPDVAAKRIAAISAALQKPESKARRSAIRYRVLSDPRMRDKLREHGKRNYHLTIGSEKAFKARQTAEAIAKRARTHSEKDRAWCPRPYWDEYTRLMRTIGATEARQMILAQIERDQARAARAREQASPFERQMEALNRGAGLTSKLNLPGRDYEFTLGGVSSI